MAPLADVKTGLKFGEVIHSTMMHRRRCCCLSGIDTQVSGGDDYASGLSAELKALYGLRDTKSSNENKIKIKSNKHRNILYSNSNFIEVDPKSPFDTIPALLQAMVWHRTDDKWLSKPMLAKIRDATWHHNWQNHNGLWQSFISGSPLTNTL